MNKIDVLNKYSIKPLYYQKKKHVDIITCSNGRYVIKKTNNSNIYEYLRVRNFNNFPNSITNNTDSYEIVDYIDDIEVPMEQRAQDLIYLTSILHAKTTFYKNLDTDTIKEIYEKIVNMQTDVYRYYMNMQDIIETEVYMSPSHYLLIRNISLFYKCIRLSKEYIDKWYDIIKDKKRLRYAMTHGNLDSSHIIENEDIYLISWDKAKIDNPIYDLNNLYRNNFIRLDLIDMLNIYESKYELSHDEKYLLFSLVLIPNRLEVMDTEYLNVVNVRKIVEYMLKISNTFYNHILPKTERN